MNIFKSFCFSLLGLAGTVATAGAEVVLPDGSGNTLGTSCSGDVVELQRGDQAWPLADGGRVAVEYSEDTSWALHCGMSNGHSTVSTTCYSAGYVVAMRVGADLMLGCYDGPMPADLK